MKVYTVQREYEYESSMIIGVFTTREAAEKCCEDDRKESNGDDCQIEEHELENGEHSV